MAARVSPGREARRTSIVFGLLLGLSGLGSSTGAIAVKPISAEFGVSTGAAIWTVSLFVLTLGTSTVVYGRWADAVGPRVPFLVGVGLMCLGALLAASAPTFLMLLAGRAVQGAGTGAVASLCSVVIGARYEEPLRRASLLRLGAVSSTVACLGPLVAGLAVDRIGWRAAIALPVIGAPLVLVVLRALVASGMGAVADVVGIVMTTLSIGGVILVVQSPSAGWAACAVGVALVAIFVPATVMWCHRHPTGFLPLEVLRNQMLLTSAWASSCLTASWFAILVGIPAVLVDEGWTAGEIGLLFCPSAVSVLLLPLLARRAAPASRPPSHRLLVPLLVSSGALLLAAIAAWQASPAGLGAAMMASTFAVGMGQPALAEISRAVTRPEIHGIAFGIAVLVFMLGGSYGSAVVGGLGHVAGIQASLAFLGVLPLVAARVIARRHRP